VRSLPSRYFHQLHRLYTAVAQLYDPPGGPGVLDPVAVLAEHRHQVALVIDPRLNERESPQFARVPPWHLQNDSGPWEQAAAKDHDPEMGVATSYSVRAATLIHRARLRGRVEER
jgi:hypothetical protein